MPRPSQLVLLFVSLSLAQGSHAHARSFTRCQLSRELLRYNFPRSLIPHWVCLIEHASGRMTDKVINHNNSYTSYGLFQIHNKDWCKKGRKGGHCSMKCEDLLNEDLADDVRCAKRIYDRVGFKAWPASYTYCKENTLPDLSSSKAAFPLKMSGLAGSRFEQWDRFISTALGQAEEMKRSYWSKRDPASPLIFKGNAG